MVKRKHTRCGYYIIDMSYDVRDEFFIFKDGEANSISHTCVRSTLLYFPRNQKFLSDTRYIGLN
jgi:hypothetical protein